MRKIPPTLIFYMSLNHSHEQTPNPASMHFRKVFPSHCLSWSLPLENSCLLHPFWCMPFLVFHNVQDRTYEPYHRIHDFLSSFFWFPFYCCDKIIWTKVTQSLRHWSRSALLKAQASTESINHEELLLTGWLTGSFSLVLRLVLEIFHIL